MSKVRCTMIATAMVGFLLAPNSIHAQPEPSTVPVAWELTFRPSPPARIQVDLGKGSQTVWYMLYQVVNGTGQDVNFHPEIVRVSEIESELPAEKALKQPGKAAHIIVDDAIVVNAQSKIFKAIQKRHAKTHPFLVSPVDAIRRLLQGDDNKLTGVAIFSDLDPRMSKFTIYFGGLSGEVVTKPNPAYDSAKAVEAGAKDDKKDGKDTDNPKFFVLRKTLKMPCTLPGDPRTRKVAKPTLGQMSWIMR